MHSLFLYKNLAKVKNSRMRKNFREEIDEFNRESEIYIEELPDDEKKL